MKNKMLQCKIDMKKALIRQQQIRLEELEDELKEAEAEPKVLSAEECLLKMEPGHQLSIGFTHGFKMGFGRGKPQGRFERDLELMPLFLAVQNFYRDSKNGIDQNLLEKLFSAYLLTPLMDIK